MGQGKQIQAGKTASSLFEVGGQCECTHNPPPDMNFNAVTQFLLAHFQNPKTKGNCPINNQGTTRHSTAQNKVNVNKEEDADSIKNYLCTVYSLSTDVLGKCLPLEASTSIYCKGYWGKTNKNGLRQLRYPESKSVRCST